MTADAAPPPTPPTPPPAAPADRIDRARLIGGLVLVIVGALFLVGRFVRVELGVPTWPLWILVPGVGLVVAGLLTGGRQGLGFVVPGTIVATVGAILWVQELTDSYATWAYAWALVAPGSVGLAMLLQGIAGRDPHLRDDGVRTLLTGIGLFVGFGVFFEGVIGLSGERWAGLDALLPAAAIGLGALLVALSVLRRPSR